MKENEVKLLFHPLSSLEKEIITKILFNSDLDGKKLAMQIPALHSAPAGSWGSVWLSSYDENRHIKIRETIKSLPFQGYLRDSTNMLSVFIIFTDEYDRLSQLWITKMDGEDFIEEIDSSKIVVSTEAQ